MSSLVSLHKYNRHLASRVVNSSISVNTNPDGRLFAFKNVTCSDVARVLHSIKSKAIGLDNIPIVFVKNAIPHISSTIASHHRALWNVGNWRKYRTIRKLDHVYWTILDHWASCHVCLKFSKFWLRNNWLIICNAMLYLINTNLGYKPSTVVRKLFCWM